MSLKTVFTYSAILFLVVVGVSLLLPASPATSTASSLGLSHALSLVLAWTLSTIGVVMLTRMFERMEQLSLDTLRHISTLNATRRGRNCALFAGACFVVSFFVVRSGVVDQLPQVTALLQAVAVGSGAFAVVFAALLSALFRFTARQNLAV